MIDAARLTDEAFGILVEDLEGFGNSLSDFHRAALLELLDTFTGFATGTRKGRLAFPLPCGMGKTSAVVAWLAAAHRLGYRIPVSVAASKVEALCALKRDLITHGVPEPTIGLKHSVPGASETSTGNESRLVQLVTHARVRSGRDFELFGRHESSPRVLCIYDETLLRCDAFALRAKTFYAAVSILEIEGTGNPNPLMHQLISYLIEAKGAIGGALDDLQEQGDPESRGAAVDLPAVEPGTVEAFKDLLGHFGGVLRGFESDLRDLLTLSQGTLRVVGSEQGDGVVTAREVVPRELRSVVILDASAPIRELARLDSTIEVVDSFPTAVLKSFERVEVHQLLSPGGRSSMQHSLATDRKEASAVSLEVAKIIKDGWSTRNAFLVFTFARRGSLDMVQELRRDLQRSGIDVEAKTTDGRNRIRWLTWGSETSTNGLEYCDTVIMAGVLHRSHLDLAAVVRGQTGNPAEPTPSSRIRELVESEIAHCILQGASRGSCRRIHDGKAMPMQLWFIHRNPTIKDILETVMPGAVWTFEEPAYLARATADSKASAMLGQIIGHLRGLPDGTERVPSRRVKAALEVPQAEGRTWSRATALLDQDLHGWSLVGQALVRRPDFAFTPR